MHTKHTIMTKLTKLRIHIAPIGFEVDRIVLPAIKYKADKVWIISEENASKDKAGKFIKKIVNEFKKYNIQYDFEMCNREDLFDIIKAIKTVFEKEKNNDLYVNVSAGSKIQAIACMMACMMFKEFNANPYYVEPKDYDPTTHGKPQSVGMKNIIDLPSYEMKKPTMNQIKTLQIIKENESITKKTLAKILDEKKVIKVGASQKSYEKVRYGVMDSNIIKPLEKEWEFIKIEQSGRNHIISLTKEGEDASRFLI